MIVSIIIICLGLFGSAFISATEVAFVGSRVYRIRHLSNNGNRNASLVLKIIEKYDKAPISLLAPTKDNWTIGTIKKVAKKIPTGKAKTNSFG